MDLWKKVKTTTTAFGTTTKLRGDITLLERDVTAKKKKFGIELYDLLTDDKKNLLGVAAGTIFKKQETELKEPFERARDDINEIQGRKDAKQQELDVLEVKSASTLPDTTVNEKMKKAGKAINDAAVSAKLKAEMALLDREIKARKEEFGIDVYELTKAAEEKKKGGISGAVTDALTSQQEKDIQACIDRAKKDISPVETRMEGKKREIEQIKEESKATSP